MNTSKYQFGNTFIADGLEDEKFDYMLFNPLQKIIKAGILALEAETAEIEKLVPA